MTNPLFEKPTPLDTAKSILALVKLGLALSGNQTAVALGSFLETLLLNGLQKWEQQPSEVPKSDDDNFPGTAVQADAHKITVTEVLSYFNIRTIEIPQESLLRLLQSDDWISAQGGISLLVPGRTVGPPSWFSAQLLPEALHGSALLLQGDHEANRLTTTFPAARPPANALHVTPDHPVEWLLEPKIQQGVPVTFTGIYKTDTSLDLIAHGIRLTPGPPLPGFLVTFQFRTANDTSSHRHVLIPSSSLEVAS